MIHMLYTVRPLERIYAQPSVFDPKQSSNTKGMSTGKMGDTDSVESQYKEVLLPNGRIVTRRDGENYVVERINSTDMQDYLNDEYVPGKSIKDSGKK